MLGYGQRSTDNLNTLMIGGSGAMVTQTEIMGLLIISWTPIKFSHSGDNLRYMIQWVWVILE